MASINVGEDDYVAVHGAAVEARDRGDDAEAAALDKLARKINAALSNANPAVGAIRKAGGLRGGQKTWQDMPSTLDGPPAKPSSGS